MHAYARAAVIAVTLASAPLFAKEPPAPPAGPPQELAQLEYFLGDWTCAGTTFASPAMAEHATTAAVHGAKILGNAWVHVTYDENKTAANPTPYHAAIQMGYDAAQKTFVSFCADSLGSWCNETSHGWDGDTMTFAGSTMMDGKATPSKDVFVRKGASELTHESDFQFDGKSWAKADLETCKKRK